MGGGIQAFMSVVTYKTFADIETNPTLHIENLPLPIRIPPNGGSQRIRIVMPVDELLNTGSLQIRIGWKLKKVDAVAIVIRGGYYCIRKVDVIINNKMQFGSSVNRDYGPEKHWMDILRGIGPTFDDLGTKYNRYNGFIPNVQTHAANVAGNFNAYTESEAHVITGVTAHTKDMRDSTTNYCLALRTIRKTLEGKEVFNMVETENEGILGATKLFPGFIAEFALIVHYMPILEMFAEEHHTTNTDAISSAFLEINMVTVSKPSVLPSKALWGMLHHAATTGGGKANLPSYPTRVSDVYNGPHAFPGTSMVLVVPITGSEVPGSVYLCVRDQRTITSKMASLAYLGLPDVKSASMTISTQGRHSFQNSGTSPFSEANNG